MDPSSSHISCPGLGIETLGLVADSVCKILCTLSVTKPNVSIPKPDHVSMVILREILPRQGTGQNWRRRRG